MTRVGATDNLGSEVNGLRSLVCAISAVLVVALSAPSTAWADDKPAVGFSNLLVRVEDTSDIGFAEANYVIHILEELRNRGFNAVGAEDLVFGRDKTRQAEYLLGGTIREVECLRKDRKLNCRVGIFWQLLDISEDRVVYEVLSRYTRVDTTKAALPNLGKELVLGALRSLTLRDKFKQILTTAKSKPATKKGERFGAATFATCGVPTRVMPEDSELILDATVLVKNRRGFGSGFLLSADGLVMTAAHVVKYGVEFVRLRDGTEVKATVIRADEQADVALLKLDEYTAGGCLRLATTATPTPGEDVYVVGAPTSEELAFSLSRGIVSGSRTLRDMELLQTDAPMSPGNSGGPLLNGLGEVTAIASWKVFGEAVEGVAFGIPINGALQRLNLSEAFETAGLEQQPVAPVESKPPPTFTDVEDEIVSLDPEADRIQEQRDQEQEFERHRQDLTPAAAPALLYGGIAAVGAGLLAALFTSSQVDSDSTTKSEYEEIRTLNDMAWVLSAAGLGMTVWAATLYPSQEEVRRSMDHAVRLRVAPTSVNLAVTF